MTYRIDIQALRGVAVLLVLLFHAKFGWGAGYLGVDVFFVISGYLVTKMIRDDMERGTFSFANFYFRRAKRLLPAAYVTFTATALLAPWFLTSEGMAQFKLHLIGALTFSANMVLRVQTDYFSGDADLKPLLHIWSLSVEEQYYFLLPAFLAFTPRRWWKPAAIAATAASLAACLYLLDRKPTFAFYVLPTRAWELGLGTIAALVTVGPRGAMVLRVLFFPALVALLVLPSGLVPTGQHPGPAALVVCVATMVVIQRARSGFFAGAAFRGLARVGDMSYSLYLVHWPIFAFLNNAWVGDGASTPSMSLRLAALGLSFVLAYVLHRYVEEPCRRAQWQLSGATAARGVAASVGVFALSSAAAMVTAPKGNYLERFRNNVGFDAACQFNDAKFHPIASCRNADAPEILVWGDSFAMHLVPGIAAGAKTVQATRAMCSPFLGLTILTPDRPRLWGTQCIEFNDSVIEYLKATPSVTTVVISSPIRHLIGNGFQNLERSADGRMLEVPAEATRAEQALRRTVEAVRAAGKRIVLVSPPPTGVYDVARCIERRDTGLVSLAAPAECNFTTAAWKASRADVNAFVDAAPWRVGLPVLSLPDILCDEHTCKTEWGKVPVFRDAAHLSYEGSVLVAREADLVAKIRAVAR